MATNNYSFYQIFIISDDHDQLKKLQSYAALQPSTFQNIQVFLGYRQNKDKLEKITELHFGS